MVDDIEATVRKQLLQEPTTSQRPAGLLHPEEVEYAIRKRVPPNPRMLGEARSRVARGEEIE